MDHCLNPESRTILNPPAERQTLHRSTAHQVRPEAADRLERYRQEGILRCACYCHRTLVCSTLSSAATPIQVHAHRGVNTANRRLLRARYFALRVGGLRPATSDQRPATRGDLRSQANSTTPRQNSAATTEHQHQKHNGCTYASIASTLRHLSAHLASQLEQVAHQLLGLPLPLAHLVGEIKELGRGGRGRGGGIKSNGGQMARERRYGLHQESKLLILRNSNPTLTLANEQRTESFT